jgi:hypothetical protein
MHDAEHGLVQLPNTPDGLPARNYRHPNDPLGWATPLIASREAVLQEVVDFIAFANTWFGQVKFRTGVLYNAAARRVDICFHSKQPESHGLKIGLEFSFERDWPVTDESDWFW